MTERRPWRHVLTDHDVTVVRECLRAAADGPFFPDDIVRGLFGRDRDALRALAETWPDLPDDEAYDILLLVVTNLTAYPHDHGRELPVEAAYLDDLLSRADEASGRHRTRARVGEPVAGWRRRPPVEPMTLTGRYVTLVPLDVEHAEALYAASKDDGAVWDYLAYGPWTDAAEYRRWLADQVPSRDPVFLTVVVDGEPRGVVSYLRIDRGNGVVEIGHIWYAPSIQRSPATTEATYLLARHVFDDLGYRRLEWKCNALNAPSRAAAERFGFTYEGTFRQHMVVKGRNRDTAWFALLDGEWPARRAAFEAWLDPANFDEAGLQRTPLAR